MAERVERFDPIWEGEGLELHPDGQWVRYSDLAEERTSVLYLEDRAKKAEDALAETLADRDAAYKAEEIAQRQRDHTEQWYAVRFERLRDLARDRSKAAERGSELAQVWSDIASILANGTLGPPDHPYEPPTYAQQLNVAKHRTEQAEAQRDQARQEVLEEVRREAIQLFAEALPRGIYQHAVYEKAREYARRLLATLDPSGESSRN
jgi:hypothetical protein